MDEPRAKAALKIASPLAVTRGLRNDIAAALLREWVNGAEAAVSSNPTLSDIAMEYWTTRLSKLRQEADELEALDAQR